MKNIFVIVKVYIHFLFKSWSSCFAISCKVDWIGPLRLDCNGMIVYFVIVGNWCKLSSSEISFSFFARSVFYFEQIIWSTSFRSLILLLLTPPGAPSISSFFTLIQTSILKNSQPEPTDFLWLMTLFNIYSAKEF